MEQYIPIIVGLIGAGGLGAFFREIVDVFTKLKGGMSARESARKRDLVSERDQAVDQAERVVRNYERVREYAAGLRVELVDHRVYKPTELPDWPELEHTITPAELRQAREKKKENP